MDNEERLFPEASSFLFTQNTAVPPFCLAGLVRVRIKSRLLHQTSENFSARSDGQESPC